MQEYSHLWLPASKINFPPQEKISALLGDLLWFYFHNITYHLIRLIGLSSLGFITKTHDKLKRVPRNA